MVGRGSHGHRQLASADAGSGRPLDLLARESRSSRTDSRTHDAAAAAPVPPGPARMQAKTPPTGPNPGAVHPPTSIQSACLTSRIVLRPARNASRARHGSGSSGCRRSGRLTQECEYLSVEPLGDLRGGRIVIGSDLAGNRVVSDTGSPIRQFLDEDGDRRVRASVGHMAVICPW